MLILEISDVKKRYLAQGQEVMALAGVSLTLAPGEFVSLVGRSGCGKSTLLHLAGAMDFPSEGTVSIDGQQTTSLDDAALTTLRRRKVGFIFQNFQLLPTLSVVENVELPLLLAGEPQERTRSLEALAWVELSDYGNRMPHQLSGGQMQRVAIARALVHRPKLLLADEPTGNLDTTTGDRILDLLRRAAKDFNAAVLMATHSVESGRVTDRTIAMLDGRIR
ncbi:ABC transporter ATP-binding protein [Bryobacter aggregatus]|uniref:ABC transporter ATP-binding protein n=1 Tax=Bryobacter aggregatus TaxID=360054 RepID=UPI0004E1AF24|nr:ABC transporter ATP-binding protein [Bryobacter aggregatus]